MASADTISLFVQPPEQYVLRQKKTGLIAEKKGVWTWLKSHVLFSSQYRLADIIETIRNNEKISAEVIPLLNSLIVKHNFTHRGPSHHIELLCQKHICSTHGFQTQYFITVKSDTAAAILQKIVQELPGTKIRFDAETKTIHFGYGPSIIRALSTQSKSLFEIIGSGYRTLFDGYMNSFFFSITAQSSNRSNSSAMLEKAKKYFHDVKMPEKVQVTLPDHCSEEQFLFNCLENRPGLCFGENHGDSYPKAFLCKHLKYLVQRGVTTLFFEHLPSESLQDELDQFLASPKDAPMPRALFIYLESLGRGNGIFKGKTDFTDVIRAAKLAGIQRIICIDTEETYKIGSSAKEGVVDTSKRVLAMNYNAARAIEANKCKGKYIVFAGGRHIDTCGDIPGISQIIGCPSIYLKSSTTAGDAGIHQNVHYTEGNITSQFDFELRG